MPTKTIEALPFESVLGNLKTNWGWVLVYGIASCTLGLMAIGLPGLATAGLSVMLGLALFAVGFLHLIESLKVAGAGNRIGYFIMALLAFVAAAAFILFPALGGYAISLMIALYLIGIGATKTAVALTHKPQTGWGWVLASGIVGTILGLWMVITLPVTGFALPGIFFGLELVASGITSLAVAFSVPKI